MTKEFIQEILEEGFEETGTIQGAFDDLLENSVRELFDMGDWDNPKSTSMVIEFKGKKYQVDIQENGCCEVTHSHRIMYWKHTVTEVDVELNESVSTDVDSVEFFDLMQAYRMAPVSDQERVTKAFNDVKDWILGKKS